jgi:ABC-type cobalamin/Fe3+-siderophores transport system ATPase subunit
MILTSLELENFKAFGSPQTITFAQPGEVIEGRGLTVVVGPNNSGKSTILKAIRHMIASEPTFVAGESERRANRPVRLRLKGADSTGTPFEIYLESRLQSAHLVKHGGKPDLSSQLKYIPARRPWQDRFHASGIVTWQQHDEQLFNNIKSNDHYVD